MNSIIPDSTQTTTQQPLSFIEILWFERWTLLGLNLCLLVASVFVVTLPAAIVAVMVVCNAIVNDQVVYFFRDFKTSLRSLFYPALYLGLLALIIFSVCGYALFVYGQLSIQHWAFSVVFIVALCVSLYQLAYVSVLFCLLARHKTLSRNLFKQAAWQLAVSPKLIFQLNLLVVGSVCLHFALYPLSALFAISLSFSFGILAVAYLMRDVMCKTTQSTLRNTTDKEIK